MLDQLRDDTFAGLEDAYGPAIDVPRQLRALVGADLEAARHALGDLYAGIFHQGSYFDATPPAIPFLIEIADADLPLRADVLLFLADMMPESAPNAPGFDPFVFRSQPGAPEYPEAIATIAAIRLGQPVFERALDGNVAEVRSAAAFLLARMPDTRDALASRYAIETDDDVRTVLVFALAATGDPPAASDIAPSIARDVAEALSATAPLSDAAASAFTRLLLASRRERSVLPFYDGQLPRFAAHVLAQVGARDARAFDVAASALEARFARGERLAPTPAPSSPRISDDDDRAPRSATFADYAAGEPLRAIAGAMAALAFGERANVPPILRREELDERRRTVLALTRDHGIPVPVRAAPFITREAMGRFLAGGGPMDEDVELDGVRAPIYVHLAPLEHAPVDAVDAAFAALARAVPEDRVVDLAADILADGYTAHTPWHWAAAVLTHLAPIARRDVAGLRRYAESLADAPHPRQEQGALALANEIADVRPPDPRFDGLARAALCRPSDAMRAWLTTFDDERRERIVAAFGNGYLHSEYAPLCDRARLENAMVERFMSSDCDWLVHEAERLLATIEDVATLEALRARATGQRARILDRVLQEKTGTGMFTLELTDAQSSIHAVLRDHRSGRALETHTFSRPPTTEDVALLRPTLARAGRPVVVLAGDLDSTTLYRVQRLFGDLGLGMEIRSGGSSLFAGG